MKNLVCSLLLLALIGSTVNCSNFLEGGILDNDPNRATDVPLDNLLVGVQVGGYATLQGPISIWAAMWNQQMAGIAQQYEGYGVYSVASIHFTAQWFDIYGGGGLADIRRLRTGAVQDERPTLEGIAKIWEALFMSIAADVWGDIPYSQANNSVEYPDPVYDSQQSVHEALLSLLDSAISDLNGASDFFDGSFDFTYGGDRSKWIAAAHTLKARILLNWAEVDNSKYAAAMAEAQQGIASDADNWRSFHTSTSGEEFIWYQFENSSRAGYVRAGSFLLDLLALHGDPRLEIYYGEDANGGYSGSGPAEQKAGVSWLNDQTYGSADWDYDLLGWHENQFIIAEAQFNMGDEAGAIATVNATQDGLEAKWSIAANSLRRATTETGTDLLEFIMVEKYKAMFLSQQIWSDWRRTGFPIYSETANGQPLPRRYLYSDDELNTNANVPQNVNLSTRVQNDPGDPLYVAGRSSSLKK